MTPAIIALLQVVAPGLLGGTLGTILGVFQTPGAGAIIAIGKRLARGDHLSEESKQILKEHNQKYYRGPYQSYR